MKHIQLENEWVLLRPLQKEDRLALKEAANDARIWTHMSIELLTDEAISHYMKTVFEQYETGESFLFVVIDKLTNKLVGATSFLDISIPHKRLEIGATWYHPSVWRTHINTNCKYLLLQYGFEHLQLNRIQIKTGHENERSQRAIERIGAHKEGILRNHMVQRNGQIRHTVMYSITKEDWENVKALFTEELLKKVP